MNPLAVAVLGFLGGVASLGFVLIAHRTGVPLDAAVQDALILGGVTSMGVGTIGARFMPTKSDEQKPGGAP